MLFKIDIESGTMRSLWTDAMNLAEFGAPEVTRASNVEFDNQRRAWFCYTPGMDGILDGQPAQGFATRKEALEWEVNWAESRL